MLVHPLANYTGVVAYLDYCASVSKGEVGAGTYFNGVYGFGDMGKERSEYTSSKVVETHTITADEASEKYVEVIAAWTPVADVKSVIVGTTTYEIIWGGTPTTGQVSVEISPSDAKSIGFTFADTITSGAEMRFGYAYNNEYIPANEIPKIKPVMRRLNLTAKTRRIAVEYSNLAQFQAKNDYGYDMAAELASQAVAELNLEIDSEAILLLKSAAEYDPRLVFSKTQPVGVSLTEHYQKFLEVIERAKRVIYDRTKKFVPNIMVIASDIMEILPFVNGWKPANTTSVAGAFQAG